MPRFNVQKETDFIHFDVQERHSLIGRVIREPQRRRHHRYRLEHMHVDILDYRSFHHARVFMQWL